MKISKNLQKLLSLPFLISTSIISIILHNLVYALTNIEEPIFFILSLISILGIIFLALKKIYLTIKTQF